MASGLMCSQRRRVLLLAGLQHKRVPLHPRGVPLLPAVQADRSPEIFAGCCPQWLICLFPMASGPMCSQRRCVLLLSRL